jgi:hypothetical protein
VILPLVNALRESPSLNRALVTMVALSIIVQIAVDLQFDQQTAAELSSWRQSQLAVAIAELRIAIGLSH